MISARERKAFSACGPATWNSLPSDIRTIDSYHLHWRSLKSYWCLEAVDITSMQIWFYLVFIAFLWFLVFDWEVAGYQTRSSIWQCIVRIICYPPPSPHSRWTLTVWDRDSTGDNSPSHLMTEIRDTKPASKQILTTAFYDCASWFISRGTRGNAVPNVKVFKNALWTALQTIFRQKCTRL